MNQNTPQPTDWHRKPSAFNGPCPICGCPGRNLGEHRGVAEHEGLETRWVKRRKSPTGWTYYAVRPKDRVKRKRAKPRFHHFGVTGKTRDKIVQATHLFAQGRMLCEVAKTLGVPEGTVADWKFTHSVLWQLAEDSAVADTVAIVRAAAGTDKVLEDPDHWLYMANKADRWCEARGEELFPTDEEMTVTRFYHEWYVPECQAPDASEAYVEQFEVALKRWRLVTGDPPLAKIDNQLLRKFRDFLMGSRGQKPGSRMSPASVRRYLTYVCRLLNKAGPPGYKNHDAAGLIPAVPWVKPPREEITSPKIATMDELNAIYRTATVMVQPQIPGINAADWWRALLVVCYNTSLRRRTLFELKMSDIDWDNQKLAIAPDQIKSRRGDIAHLNKTVLEHLRKIRTDRDLIFPWPYCREYFDKVFHDLQYQAGLPRKSHVGLHDIRKTTATVVAAEAGPETARVVLGHRSVDVTLRHYIQREGIRTQILDRLPQPEAFTGGDGRKHTGG